MRLNLIARPPPPAFLFPIYNVKDPIDFRPAFLRSHAETEIVGGGRAEARPPGPPVARRRRGPGCHAQDANGHRVLPFAVHVADVLDGLVGFLEAPVSPAAREALEDTDPDILAWPLLV